MKGKKTSHQEMTLKKTVRYIVVASRNDDDYDDGNQSACQHQGID